MASCCKWRTLCDDVIYGKVESGANVFLSFVFNLFYIILTVFTNINLMFDIPLPEIGKYSDCN